MRATVSSRLRRWHASDPHAFEHWLWQAWSGAIDRFDPAQVDSFSGFVALRLNMAGLMARRECDVLPRRARERVRAVDAMARALVEELGRELRDDERDDLARQVVGSAPMVMSSLPLGDLPEVMDRDADPAAQVERRLTDVAVRAAIESHPPAVRRALLAWLDAASAGPREPRLRDADVPASIRGVLQSLSS